MTTNRVQSVLALPESQALRSLTRDGRLLFIIRMVRMAAYGLLSVVLVLYLTERGLTGEQVGLLLSATLFGDVVLSLWIAVIADRTGRRRMLMIGVAFMIFAGLALAFSESLPLFIIAAVVGTISPTGNEVGPFLSIEQAILPQVASRQNRTSLFAWYNLVGSFATAFGALVSGGLATLIQQAGRTPLDSYRLIVLSYGLLGVVLLGLFSRLSPQVEAPRVPNADRSPAGRFGLHRSQSVVYKLASLFMLDAFAGGLVIQSVIAYWFSVRFGVTPGVLGGIFFGANLLSGVSALAAGRIAARFGLVNTMVWTHIPSNLLLLMVPLMPSLSGAILVLLARYSISQMDVPTRQSYIMAVVAPDERSAAAGITTLARTAAASIAPTLTGILFGYGLFAVPFFAAGALKIVYDLILYRSFRAVKPHDE